ncbi:MAG: hypothetical protein ACREDJ_02755 [Methylocella sp.]
MIQSGFPGEEDRKALTALARCVLALPDDAAGECLGAFGQGVEL